MLRRTRCYVEGMRIEDIRAFVARPRGALERLKHEYWASVSSDARGDSVPLGHLLLEHALAADPTYPSDAARHEDYEHHVRVTHLVNRARATFQGR